MRLWTAVVREYFERVAEKKKRDDEILKNDEKLRKQEEKEGICSFWFLKAEMIRNGSAQSMPVWQELRSRHADWLEKRQVNIFESYTGRYKSNFLAISHRYS